MACQSAGKRWIVQKRYLGSNIREDSGVESAMKPSLHLENNFTGKKMSEVTRLKLWILFELLQLLEERLANKLWIIVNFSLQCGSSY